MELNPLTGDAAESELVIASPHKPPRFGGFKYMNKGLEVKS